MYVRHFMYVRAVVRYVIVYVCATLVYVHSVVRYVRATFYVCVCGGALYTCDSCLVFVSKSDYNISIHFTTCNTKLIRNKLK